MHRGRYGETAFRNRAGRGGWRGGAGLRGLGLPAAYVPLPHGNGEQRLNAAPIVSAGGGMLVDDADLTPGWIRDNVLPVLRDPARVAAMSQAAASMGHRDADAALAREVMGVLEGTR